MNLSFSLTINQKRSYFPEKILGSIKMSKTEKEEVAAQVLTHPDLSADVYLNSHPKIHTIRIDRAERWQKGKDIHFIIHNRSKKRFQFAPVRKVISTQEITISNRYIQKSITGGDDYPMVIVDGEQLNYQKCLELAINDGFKSLNEFMEYFSEDFKGKLIHWTNYKY
jgi:hypothetical protein